MGNVSPNVFGFEFCDFYSLFLVIILTQIVVEI